MGGVADDQQSVGVPAPQPAQRDREELDVLERFQGVDPVREPGEGEGDPGTKGDDARAPQGPVGPLLDQIRPIWK